MKYKLMAIDLDGTLLTKFKNITKQDLLSINKYQSDGGIAFLSTGRPAITAEKYMNRIHIFTNSNMQFVVAYNGSYIKDYKNDKVYEWLITKELALEIYQISKDENINIWFYTKENAEENVVLSSSLQLRLGSKMSRFITIKKYTGNENLTSYKINLFSLNPNKVKKVFSLLEKKYRKQLNICLTTKNLIEITYLNINKGSALTKIAEILNIKKENTMALGDSFNDLPAFKAAGFAVGIKPANADLYPYCDEIIYSKKNGISNAIKQFVYGSSSINSFLKLIVTDLDGTLLGKDKIIDPTTKMLLQKVTTDYKIPVVIASGRNVNDISKVFKYLSLNPALDYYVVSNNGALIYNYTTQKYLMTKEISYEDSLKVMSKIAEIQKQGTPIGAKVYQKETEVFVVNPKFVDDFFIKMYGPGFKDIWATATTSEFVSLKPKTYIKFGLFFIDQKTAAKYCKIFQKEFPNLETCQTVDGNVEINAKDVSKGNGLKILSEHLNIDCKNMMIFGDHCNDLSMLKLSNYSFCPISAPKSVQTVCKHVMNFPSSTFLAKAINEFLLFETEKKND